MAKPGKPTTPQASIEDPKFRTCDLFNETFTQKSRDYPVIGAKFQEFRAAKSANKLAPFGSSDKPFKSFGVFEGLKHAHLTGDVSVVYSIHGSNPSLIDLYGVFSHDELGTGQPVNIKRQKSMDKKLSSQTFR